MSSSPSPSATAATPCAAQKARYIFNVPRVVCRIGDPARQKMYRDLGLEAVSPTESTSTSILRAVEL